MSSFTFDSDLTVPKDGEEIDTAKGPYPDGLVYTGPSEKSGHKLANILKCPQLYAYKEVDPTDPLGRRTGTTSAPPLIKGSLGHQGYAQFFARLFESQNGGDPDKYLPPIQGIEARAAYEGGVWGEFLPEVIPTVRWALQQAILNPPKVERIEEQLLLTLITGEEVTRSVDLGIWVPTPKEGVFARRYVDHKFVGRISKRTIERYTLADQFLDYRLIGLQEQARTGIPFGGVYLNIVEWAKQGNTPKQVQVEVPAPSKRALIRRLEEIQRGRALEAELLASGRHPRDWPRNQLESVCNGPYSLCPGFNLCVSQ